MVEDAKVDYAGGMWLKMPRWTMLAEDAKGDYAGGMWLKMLYILRVYILYPPFIILPNCCTRGPSKTLEQSIT